LAFKIPSGKKMNAFPIYEPLQRRKKRFIQRNGKTDYFVLVKEVKEYVMSGSLSLLQESLVKVSYILDQPMGILFIRNQEYMLLEVALQERKRT
jgi:hypothetical protein